jgi:hypothetical protein
MSNREIAQSLFVTTKTVESQLSAVYQKLHIRGRAELAAKLQEVVPPPDPRRPEGVHRASPHPCGRKVPGAIPDA